ncbi:uncharacterized protein LOC142632459 [Castanea sativa]|uniref:uncharacterized protein LOC142632459 n=1 Tax=Castanea sativa TaxID=21020 RepID=UPI003F64947C
MSTFRMGLPEDSRLRELLTRRPLEDMRQLIRRIEEYKWLEDDWLQSKEICTGKQPSEKKLRYTKPPIAFDDDDDMEGTIQPHDDALVITTRIKDFLVKRVMIDQGSSVDVMYPDLYRGLGLKKEDLSKYDTLLMGFDGHMIILEGQISLSVSMEGKEVIVTFIVVFSFSPYTAILERPWIHAMGVVPSTLHVKVKFYTKI